METAVKQTISLAMCEPVYHKTFPWYMTNNIKKQMHTLSHTKFREFNDCLCNCRSTTITISLTSCATSSAGAKRVKKYTHAVARAHIGTRYKM